MEKSRLLLISLIGLTALSAMSLATSLAWYSSATNLKVNTLEIEIDGDKDLLISTSAEGEKKEKLVSTELSSVARFAPVSTMFESRWRDGKTLPKFYEYTNLLTSGDGVPFGPEEIHMGFYSETLYLTADDDVYVGIDPDFSFVRASEPANRLWAKHMVESALGSDFTEEELVERLNTLEKAIRVSFYDPDDDKYVIVDPFQEGTTYYGGLLDNDRDGYYDVYAEEGTGFQKEIVFGECNDRSLIEHGERLALAEPAVGEKTSFNAGHSMGTHPFDLTASKEKGFAFKEEKSYRFEELGDNDIELNPFYVTCYRNKPKPLQVSIYLEGWDLDCVNANMGGSFEASLQLKILRETGL